MNITAIGKDKWMKKNEGIAEYVYINVGHLLLELGFDSHSTPQFLDLTNKFTKQNSIPEFDRIRLRFRQ